MWNLDGDEFVMLGEIIFVKLNFQNITYRYNFLAD